MSLQAQAQGRTGAAASLPTLKTARAAHSISLREAARGYPVHLRGVVTYYDPGLDPRYRFLFFHDETGSMFVAIPLSDRNADAIRAGTLVDIRGITGTGDYAPVIAQPQLKVLGSAPLPEHPPKVTLTHLLTGAEDGQWVEAEGVVRSIFATNHNIIMQLAMADGLISAMAPREPGVDYNHLVDATIRLHANAGPLFNGNGQMVGARFFFPNLSAIQVIEAATGSPFLLPVRPTNTLAQFDTLRGSSHRVHLRGIVTLERPGSLLCIEDATDGLCAQTEQTDALPLGTLVDVVGFIGRGDVAPVLTDANFRRADPATTPVDRSIKLTPIAGPAALAVQNDAKVIQVEGDLVGRSVAPSRTALLLAVGDRIVEAVLPKGLHYEAGVWNDGTRLRVTGISSVQLDPIRSAREGGTVVPKSFQILVRSPEDLVVTRVLPGGLLAMRCCFWPRH